MAKKSSKIEVNKKLEDTNRSVRLIGEYINSTTNTLFTDLICGHEWQARPDNVMNLKSGCAHCSKTKKLTIEQINDRLIEENRSIRLIGNYKNNRTKTVFKCDFGHEFMAIVNSVLDSSSGCPECVGRKKQDINTVNSRLSDRRITLLESFNTVHDKVTFMCHLGHKWKSKVNGVLSGIGCPKCSNRERLTPEEIKNRLNNRGIYLEGEFNKNGISSLKCRCGHEWSAAADRIFYACRECRKNGFDSSKPAIGYILIFDSFIKYGITNVLDSRLNQHKRVNGNFKIYHIENFINGHEAQEWEYSIKKVVGGKFVGRELCPDGHTETLSLEKINALMSHLNNFKQRKYNI
jgi:predicted  nucleic acid-binding Zn-ribbon protein